MKRGKRGWVIFTGNTMLLFTVWSTRKQCIKEFMRSHYHGQTWKELDHRWVTCRRVVVKEV